MPTESCCKINELFIDTLLTVVAPKQSNAQPHVACTPAKTDPGPGKKGSGKNQCPNIMPRVPNAVTLGNMHHITKTYLYNFDPLNPTFI